MLPYDRRPWAKSLAKFVIILSTCTLIGVAIYLHHIGQLRPPEYVGILILFLTIVPPNIAIVRRKSGATSPPAQSRPQAIVH